LMSIWSTAVNVMFRGYELPTRYFRGESLYR